MRILIPLVAVIILLVGAALVCHAQDSNTVPVDVALSNLLAQASALKVQLAAAKAAVSVQTVIYSNGVAVATNTAIVPVTAASLTSYIPMFESILTTLGSIGAAILIFARSLRKIIPDNLQTGLAGQVLRHFSLEVNPPTIAELKANPVTNQAPAKPPVPPAAAALLIGLLSLGLMVGCASTSTTVFNTEKTISDGAKGATHAFNVYYHQQLSGSQPPANIDQLNNERDTLYAADRTLSASLAIVENLREAYTTNSTPDNLTALNIGLQAAIGQSSNIVALATMFISPPK